MTRRPFALGIALEALVALFVSGCGSSTPTVAAPESSAEAQQPSLLPPRPTDLRIDDGIDACTLLTTAQRGQLMVDSINRSPRGELPGCDFEVGRAKQASSWSLGFERPRKVEQAARGEGALVVQVGGFPAVQTRSSVFDAAYHCIYDVDIAPDQTLGVMYSNDSKDIPGMNHDLACKQTAKVAEMVVANLRTLSH